MSGSADPRQQCLDAGMPAEGSILVESIHQETEKARRQAPPKTTAAPTGSAVERGERPVTSPALRYHGGKFRLASWIMQYFPEHTCYVEPFGGAAGVLLQKPRVYAEVYNDLDHAVYNFFKVIQNPEKRQRLIEALVFTPYSRDEFEQAWEPTSDPIEEAKRLCIRAQMGFGSAGATNGKTGFRIDTKREYGTAQHLWALYPESIATAGQRLSGVLIENRDASKVMLDHDSEETLHFIDPPYVHETRIMSANRTYYKHELSNDDHESLLIHIKKLSGYVVLSGYDSELYNDHLKHWAKFTTQSRIAASRGTKLRTEVAWVNPSCMEALNKQRPVSQKALFDV